MQHTITSALELNRVWAGFGEPDWTGRVRPVYDSPKQITEYDSGNGYSYNTAADEDYIGAYDPYGEEAMLDRNEDEHTEWAAYNS